MKIRVIVNPSAGGGSTGKKLVRLEKLLRARDLNFDIFQTEGPGHASSLASQAHRDRVDILAVMGGDGTFNEVSQSYLNETGQPVSGPMLSLVPSGTGGDLRRSFGFTASVEAAVARLSQPQPVPMDLGSLQLRAPSGGLQRFAFLNVTSLGISAVIAKRTNDSAKRLGGRIAFLSSTLRTALTYQNSAVRLFDENDRLHYEGPVFAIGFANGRYFGGGMHIAPHACPHDARLECILVKNLSRLASYRLTSRLYSGKHLSLADVETLSGNRFRVEGVQPKQEIPVETDGETPGSLPLSVALHPAAVQMLA